MDIAEKVLIQPDPEIRHLVDGYLENVRRDLGAVGRGLEAGDLQKARSVGHILKGTGASFDCGEITRLGGLLEEAAKSGDVAAARDRVQELAAYVLRIEVAPS
ncbi:MAG: hypothetical protein A2X36_13635 [Elusimicrobia bacterium GWA2_69_24]|nr:MAG: hypothetical protein A2X36_13635 [Elusimicrobia bacterium GWA2_69_24]HBL18769.1 hypothetical protein [Elusimicrobiota bacterium]